MRVPIRSAGTRSGVNWIRWNSPPTVCASVLMAIVLARPGTPSTSTWPRARRATMSRSSSRSWPTSSFFTWNTTCSMGAERGGGRLMDAPRSLLGGAGGTAGRGDRHGEADPDEEGLRGRIGQGRHDADDLAGAVQEGAARVAGVHGGVELDEPVEGHAAVEGDRPVEARHDARREGIGE